MVFFTAAAFFGAAFFSTIFFFALDFLALARDSERFFAAALDPVGSLTRLTINAGTTVFSGRVGLGRNKIAVNIRRCQKTENTSI